MIKLRFWPFIPSPLRGALKTRGFPGFSSNVAEIECALPANRSIDTVLKDGTFPDCWNKKVEVK